MESKVESGIVSLFNLVAKFTPKVGRLVISRQNQAGIGKVQLVEDQTDLSVDLKPCLPDYFHEKPRNTPRW